VGQFTAADNDVRLIGFSVREKSLGSAAHIVFIQPDGSHSLIIPHDGFQARPRRSVAIPSGGNDGLPRDFRSAEST